MKHSHRSRPHSHSGKPGKPGKFGASPFRGKEGFKPKDGLKTEGGFRGDGFKSRGGFKGKKSFTPKDELKTEGSFRGDSFKPRGGLKGKEGFKGRDEHKGPSFKGKPYFKGKEGKVFSGPRPGKAAEIPGRHHDKRNSNTDLIWGLHAVRAAWLNPKRRCLRLWLTESGRAAFEPNFAEATEALLKRPDPKIVERHELERLTPPGSVHQGILLEADPLHEPALHEIIAGDNPPDVLLMLDQVTDPHNVGAILRSAAAFGAGAVIMTERNAPVMTGVQAKSASGATEHLPQIHVVNLARALDELQEAGYWRIGLAEEGEKTLGELDLSGRTVLVVGNEGDGLRQLTRKKCDELAKLPTGGPIGSLNVSNAAAVALYEVRRQKRKF